MCACVCERGIRNRVLPLDSNGKYFGGRVVTQSFVTRITDKGHMRKVNPMVPRGGDSTIVSLDK